MGLDYASIIAAGQNLVPNLAQQDLQRQELQFRQNALQEQVAQRKLAVEQAQAKQQRQAEFQAAVKDAIARNDVHAIPRLMVQYPEFAEQVKPGYDAMSKDGRALNLGQIGTIIARASNGDSAGAAQMLEQRIAADRAAGQDTSEEERALAMLRSDNPLDRNGALFGLRAIAYAADPEGYDKMAGALGIKTADPTELQKNYQWLLANKGQAQADQYLALNTDKFVPVQAGGSIYRGSDLIPPVPQTERGGDQSTGVRGIAPTGSAIEQAAMAAVPGLTVTSRQRSPGKNAAVGGVPDSYHQTDQARDFVPPKGMSMADFHARLTRAFPGFDVLNERDHVHIEPGTGTPHRQSGPARVRSKQEYDRLPSGAEYIAPDGSHRRKN